MNDEFPSKLSCLVNMEKTQQFLKSFKKVEEDLNKLKFEFLNLIFLEHK